MAAQVLIIASAGIVSLLGVVHLTYTFRGRLLTPRDPALQTAMNRVSPVISKETTMWRCWVGFNATHGIGLILFGLVFGYLAIVDARLLFASPFLLAVGLAALVGYAVLAKACFFSVPFIGVLISTICFIAGMALPHA
jgi:hypothetical protein